jgi:hypothetical protein
MATPEAMRQALEAERFRSSGVSEIIAGHGERETVCKLSYVSKRASPQPILNFMCDVSVPLWSLNRPRYDFPSRLFDCP